jgi:hypothetical protein
VPLTCLERVIACRAEGLAHDRVVLLLIATRIHARVEQVPSRVDHAATRRAHGAGPRTLVEYILKRHPVFSQPVECGRRDRLVAVGRDRIGRLVVTQDKQNIEWLTGLVANRGPVLTARSE